MQLGIADTFTETRRLTGKEQRAAKTTAFDLLLNPALPGMQFHRVDRARDKNFWSVRVNRGVAHDRAQDGRQPPALLRRGARRRLSLGGTPAA